MKYEKSKLYAQFLDSNDKLAEYRDKFFYPKDNLNRELIYFAGNSLGLQPKKVKKLL